MQEQILRDFLMLLVTIDPIGTLSLFVPLTAKLSSRDRLKVAVRSVVYAGIILVGFLVAGQLVLKGLGVELESFQLAGGIILFLLGLQMVFGTGVAAPSAEGEPDHDVAVFPLAIPSIASPGSIMAIVLLTDNYQQSIAQQALTGGVLVVVLIITLVTLILANPIHRWLGNNGSNIMVRVMGLLLAALATEQVIEGLEVVIRNMRVS